jgi:DNA polymerase-4
MPGIGKVTEPELLSLGIVTIGDLQQMGQEKLRARFGKFGDWLYTKSCGRDIDAYQYEEEPKSISHETTFDTNIDNAEEVERTLSYLAQLVGRRLRDHRLFARTIGLKIRFAPFRTVTRDVTLDEPTNLDSVIYSSVLRLLANAWDSKDKIRLVGVRSSNLGRAAFQRGLIDSEQRAKMGKVLQAADKMREKFGFDAVQLARSVEPDAKSKPRKRRQFLGRE